MKIEGQHSYLKGVICLAVPDDSLYSESGMGEIEALRTLEKSGIMSPGEVHNIILMTQKNKVEKIHPYAISQGQGQDTRWNTKVVDPVTGERKKVSAKTEEKLYEKLYCFYYSKKAAKFSLKDIYPEWMRFRQSEVRSSTIRRNDSDYKLYLSGKPIETIPIAKISLFDVRKWGNDLLSQYNLTRKAFNNIKGVLSQCIDYYIEAYNYIDRNVVKNATFKTTQFKGEKRRTASTETFKPDEIARIVEKADELSREYNDEMYLAIPIMLYCGLRPEECMALSFEDLKDGKLRIHRELAAMDSATDKGWSRKWEIVDTLKRNHGDRIIDIREDVPCIMDKIRTIVQSKGDERGHLFNAQTLKPLETRMKNVCAKADVEYKPPKHLRKTYASHLYKLTHDWDYVATQLGQDNTTTAPKYYVFSTSDESERQKVLNLLYS